MHASAHVQLHVVVCALDPVDGVDRDEVRSPRFADGDPGESFVACLVAAIRHGTEWKRAIHGARELIVKLSVGAHEVLPSEWARAIASCQVAEAVGCAAAGPSAS